MAALWRGKEAIIRKKIFWRKEAVLGEKEEE